MAPERTYTEEQLQAELERRERFRTQLVDEVRDALKPQLQRMAEEISESNHVKQELAEELRANTKATGDLQERLEEHAQLSFHRIGAQLIDDTGLLTLSQEERRALPEVLQDHVQARRQGKQQDGRRRWKLALWDFATHAIAALIGAVGVGIAAYEVMHS